MDEDNLIEALAETIEEEISGIDRAEVLGGAINLYMTFDHPSCPVPVHAYAATVGFHKGKIVFSIHNTDVHIDKDINDPGSFEVVFDKIREMVGAIRGQKSVR